MSETFFEKWTHRISSAWAVLTGDAFACYYADAFPEQEEADHVGSQKQP